MFTGLNFLQTGRSNASPKQWPWGFVHGEVPGCGIVGYDSVHAGIRHADQDQADGSARPYRSGPGINDSCIYVVYKNDQVYPEFAVTYDVPKHPEIAHWIAVK